MKKSNTTINKEVTFLIMVDSSDESKLAVEIVTKLAKESGGKIELFYPIDGKELTKSESQLTAMRSIEEAEAKVTKTLKTMEEIVRREKMQVKKSYTYGLLKFELRERLEANTNVTLVLSKTNFQKVSQGRNSAIKNFTGTTLILGENSTFLTATEVQLLYPNFMSPN